MYLSNLTVLVVLTFNIFLSLLSRPCVSSVARLSVFGIDTFLPASVSMDDDGSTLPIAFNRSSTVIYNRHKQLVTIIDMWAISVKNYQLTSELLSGHITTTQNLQPVLITVS